MAAAPSATGDIRTSVDATFDAGGTAVTGSFDAGSDTNRFLIIVVNWHNVGSHTMPDAGVTFDSVGLTAFGATVAQGNTRKRGYYLAAPNTGSHTWSVDPAAGIGNASAIIEIFCYSGVDQGTPYDGYDTAVGADAGTPFISAITIAGATGDLVFVSHAVSAASTTGGTATGFTERTDNVNATASTIASVSGDTASGASIATEVDWAGPTAINFGCLGLNMNSAAGGGGGGTGPQTPSWNFTGARSGYVGGGGRIA